MLEPWMNIWMERNTYNGKPIDQEEKYSAYCALCQLGALDEYLNGKKHNRKSFGGLNSKTIGPWKTCSNILIYFFYLITADWLQNWMPNGLFL